MASQALDYVLRLRRTSLLLIVAGILTLVGVSSLLGFIFSAPVLASYGLDFAYFITAGLSFIIILIVGVAIEIVGVLIMRGAFMNLRAVDAKYGVGSTGATLQLLAYPVELVGLILIVTSAFVLSIEGFLGGYALLIIGSIASFVGAILIAMGLFRLGSDHHEGLVQAGGILYIFIPFIGAILLYIGLSNIAKAMSSGKPST